MVQRRFSFQPKSTWHDNVNQKAWQALGGPGPDIMLESRQWGELLLSKSMCLAKPADRNDSGINAVPGVWQRNYISSIALPDCKVTSPLRTAMGRTGHRTLSEDPSSMLNLQGPGFT